MFSADHDPHWFFVHLLQAYSYSKPRSKLTCLRTFPQLYHCIRLNFVNSAELFSSADRSWNVTSWIIYILSQDNVLGRHPHTYYSHLPSRCICLGSSPLCRRCSVRGGLTGSLVAISCSPENFFITVYLLGVHSLCLFAGTGLTTWGGLSWNLWMPCISPRFILCHVPVVQQVFQFKVSCGTWNLSNLNVLNSWRSREPRAFGHLCINLWT